MGFHAPANHGVIHEEAPGLHIEVQDLGGFVAGLEGLGSRGVEGLRGSGV